MAATVTRKNINQLPVFANTPYGNETRLTYNLTTNASGVWVDSDQATAIIVGDVLRLGIIPAGLEIHDCLLTVSDKFSEHVTCTIGFDYVDGVDTTPAEHAAYFGTYDLHDQTDIFRKTGIRAPAKLPKDAYLTLTVATNNCAAVGVLDVSVLGVWTGLPA